MATPSAPRYPQRPPRYNSVALGPMLASHNDRNLLSDSSADPPMPPPYPPSYSYPPYTGAPPARPQMGQYYYPGPGQRAPYPAYPPPPGGAVYTNYYSTAPVPGYVQQLPYHLPQQSNKGGYSARDVGLVAALTALCCCCIDTDVDMNIDT